MRRSWIWGVLLCAGAAERAYPVPQVPDLQ